MGMMIGAVLVFYFLGGMLLQLAGLKDSMRRVRIVASGDRRCPFLWLIALGFWDRKVQTKMIRIKRYKREVVNLWPLQLGQFSEDLFLQHGTRVTHTAIVEVAGRVMKVMYPVNNMARKHEDISNEEVEVYTFHHKISLFKADISLTGTKDKPQSKKFSKNLQSVFSPQIADILTSSTSSPGSRGGRKLSTTCYSVLRWRTRWRYKMWGTWWRR